MADITKFIASKKSSGPFSIRGVRVSLLLIVLAAFVPIFVFVMLNARNQTRAERAALRGDLTRWAEVMASAAGARDEDTQRIIAAFAQTLPSDGIINVFDRQGRIIARYPAEDKTPSKWIGNYFPQSDLVQTVIKQQEGVEEIIDLDGETRLYAFRPFLSTVAGFPNYIAVGASLEEIFYEVNKLRNSTLIGLGVLATLGGIVALLVSQFFILRPVSKLTKIVKALGGGDLTVRLGPPYKKGELGQFARTFDQMAERIAGHAADLERAVKERTAELEEKIRELEKINAFVAERETRITELKSEIERLKNG